LQIDTDLLRIITSTADELSGGINIDDLERPGTPKIVVFSEFFRDFKQFFEPVFQQAGRDLMLQKMNSIACTAGGAYLLMCRGTVCVSDVAYILKVLPVSRYLIALKSQNCNLSDSNCKLRIIRLYILIFFGFT